MDFVAEDCSFWPKTAVFDGFWVELRSETAKIRSNGFEKSQLGTQCKNQIKWSGKESIGYTMIKLDQMVLKGVNWVCNTKIGSYDLERSQFLNSYYTIMNLVHRI